jgi:hypothetical protein
MALIPVAAPSSPSIGFHIAKSVFQVHGINAEGKVVIRCQLNRRRVLPFFQKLPPCLAGIEACASSHYWSRELHALGHTQHLMPAAYVKLYVKRHKNDAADGEAVCEAITRPNMRFVATKTSEQQSCLTLHRTRRLCIRQQTAAPKASGCCHLLHDPGHCVRPLPTPEFRLAAFESRGTMWSILNKTSNPKRTLSNLLERDRLFTERLQGMVETADLSAIMVDGL